LFQFPLITIAIIIIIIMAYWHQRADERHGSPPEGNQELLKVKGKGAYT